MRLFLAIELPDAVRNHFAGFRESVEKGIVGRYGLDIPLSYTRPENLHVTVKFLGEVQESSVPGLTEALGQVEGPGAADVWVGHTELLPLKGPVRVVSAGLDGDVGRVNQLQSRIEAACAGEGFEPERRKFLPHMTLARARQPLRNRFDEEVRLRLTERLQEYLPTQTFRVDGFTLFESRLGGGPPYYIPLARFGG